jgi:glucosamine--fructose-6-phosphate aminotransferase (isomerizing)
MCGIVGYVGDRDAADILLNGLKRLEYRGYDSAGIVLQHDRSLALLKNRGKVQDLADRVHREWPAALLSGTHIGIAHTRWATHGPPNEANAHPHLDNTGHIALVHNGIIENYAEIRRQLTAKGHTFTSETDSEVLSHLIGECYDGDLVQATCAALQRVEGAFGIAVVDDREPDHLVVARRGSPIVLGIADDETFVASDPAAIVAHTRQVMFLDDDDVADIHAGDVDLRNIHNVPVTREVARLDWDADQAEKSGYAHFMLKEIMEQPDALRNTARGRLDLKMGTAILSGLQLTPREITEIQRVVLVACGTSLHAAMIGEYFFEDLADLPTDVEHAAEFRYRNPILSHRDLVTAITQSGETADTLAAVREAKQKGPLVTAICNVVASTIARETGRGVYLHAGPEIGVASTKAFTCQLTVLLMTALKFGRCHRLTRQAGLDLCEEILRIPDLVLRALEQNETIARIAERFRDVSSCFFIGRGYMYPVAMEGALKLKEISYIHAEGYHAAELKHGPIALLEDGVPVIAMLNDLPGKEKIAGNVQECRARGATVIAVATEGDDSIVDAADEIIRVPRSSMYVAAIPTAVTLQLLAYHVARLRGCSIDQPRNLAKSVTVE